MNQREAFEEAAGVALELLDDATLQALTFTIHAHISYKERKGYSVSEEQQWEQELKAGVRQYKHHSGTSD